MFPEKITLKLKDQMENIDSKKHNIGKKLEKLLRLRKISKVEFAEMIGKSRNQIYSYLESEDVSSKLLRDWSEKLDVPIEYWFKDFNINIKGNSNTLNNIGAIGSTSIENKTKESSKDKKIETLEKEIEKINNDLSQREDYESESYSKLIETLNEIIIKLLQNSYNHIFNIIITKFFLNLIRLGEIVNLA